MVKWGFKRKRKKQNIIELVLTGKSPQMDRADGINVGEETVPGVRLQCICRGHNGTIGRIAWSPCGRFIASPSTDKTIKIWDGTNGKCLTTFDELNSITLCIAWSTDGRFLGFGLENGSIGISNVVSDSNKILGISAPNIVSGHTKLVWGVVFSPNTNTFASAGADGRVRIWNTESLDVQYEYAHIAPVRSIEWSQDERSVILGDSENHIGVWEFEKEQPINSWTAHAGGVHYLSRSRASNVLASCGRDDATIKIWDTDSWANTDRLEGHTQSIWGLDFSFDGKFLGSKSEYGSIQLWDPMNWVPIVQFKETVASNDPKEYLGVNPWSGLAFNPSKSVLATHGEYDRVIRIWKLDNDKIYGAASTDYSIRYTSAKIVFVGESNVGKSCLSMRLAENRFPNEDEQGTTHGMRFWTMEAEDLHPSIKPPKEQRRDVVLWDFGGQDDYRLVHQMFLHDTTLAVLLIDPTRGRSSINEARDWSKRLEKHLSGKQAVTLLAGAQVDNDKRSELINRRAIKALCQECGFIGFYETSSLNGRRINEFRDALATAIDWENLAKTSRPELFQRIRDDIDERRMQGEVVVLLERFKQVVQKAWPKLYDEAAVDAVTDQLAAQGIVVRTKLTGGNDAIVLQLAVIERYAGSLIVMARENPRGVPALETGVLGSPNISLPGMTNEDRVSRIQERIVLEAVVELMIEHGVCFRHEGLLVFPTLLQSIETEQTNKLPGSVSIYYDFSGAIDNVYASLISWLVIGQGFGRVRLWENRVEFDTGDEGVCGLRKVNRGGGFAHMDIYFHDHTTKQIQSEFISFVHQHLRSSGIAVVEHLELICSNKDCRYEFPRNVIEGRLVRGEVTVNCPVCDIAAQLLDGIQQERERDEQVERKAFALMTRVRNNVPKIVASIKRRAFGRGDEEYHPDRPIRVLHLSDLHFTTDTVPQTMLQWLIDDISKGSWLKDDELDYVVISGDMTHQGLDKGFDRAFEFVSLLNEQFGLSAERFVVVPGNHDVQELDDAYELRKNPTDNERKRAIVLKEQELFLVPQPEKYLQRLKAFSEKFYHPLLQKPYPLDPRRQGIAYIFPETKLQFMTLNSCWEIDQFHRTQASIHSDAIAQLITEADQQIQQPICSTEVLPKDYLRIGVWHHPVADVERGIRNREFLGNLQNNDVRVCLTGDVHEMRRELVNYWHNKRMHIVGGGSFGSSASGRPESTPRLYNLLEIQPDHRSIRVHTRRQNKPDGPWDGWYEWDDPDGEGRVPYYDINLIGDSDEAQAVADKPRH